MKEIKQDYLTGERALFQGSDLNIYDTVFADGESPLKESKNIYLKDCLFKWKYPLWLSHNVTIENSTLFDMARAGIWYTHNISVKNSIIEAPKNFRRCTGVNLFDVQFPNAQETLWSCDGVKMKGVTAKGDYFAMNSKNIEAENFNLIGNYSFDGAQNVVIRNSKLLSKDAFWNSKNVTVYDSFISGEYLGWNAENLTLINCTIESLQGMCYIKNLVLKNCRLVNTTLSFEYSSVDAQLVGKVDSIFNPSSGVITVDEIGKLIMEKDKVDCTKTRIVCGGKQLEL